jgi:hypothetical protein
MKRLKVVGIGLGLTLIVVACAPMPQSYVPDINYAHNADNGMFYLRWNCTYDPPFMVIQGTANNAAMNPLKNTQISVTGVNAQGQQVSSAVDNSLPYMLETMIRTPFTIKVQAAGTEVAFNMTYSYEFGPFMGMPSPNLINNACPGVPR